MYSNTSYCYCKISGFKTIAVAQYTWSELYYVLYNSIMYMSNKSLPYHTCTMQSVCPYNTSGRQS